MQRDGKVAIVTGVSSGIGQASAKALAPGCQSALDWGPLIGIQKGPLLSGELGR